MIKHRIFIVLTVVKVAVLFALVLYCRSVVMTRELDEIPAKRALAGQLELTDLAVWTEARYTRHPSQADFFSPFQDFPSALEHFPAGSVVGPPKFDVPTTPNPH
jgi:hypothetical protein